MNYNESNYINSTFEINDTITFNYTGSYKAITLPPGKFLIECFGASGGSGGGFIGGNGGYTSGVITIKQFTNLFIYVGGFNTEFNGGGSNYDVNNNPNFGGRGGGSSDIRLVEGSWNNIDSLYSRIMVSAGGGGANYRGSGYGGGNGGDGGGLIGGNGFSSISGGSGKGGSQTTGFLGDIGIYSGFGYGARGQSGGGSGYYGGASAGHAGGGGGSSFISGLEGCNAIDENGNHTDQPVHYSKVYFENPLTKTGINNGHGKIIITVLEKLKMLFLKDDKIQYFRDGQFHILEKKTRNILDITLEDFFVYGVNSLLLNIDDIENLSVLTLDENFSYKRLPKIATIYDKIDKKRWNINKVKKLLIEDIGSIKYVIHNGKNIYSWKNSEWGKYHCDEDIFSNQDILNMSYFGMNSSSINQLTEEHWSELWSSIDSCKYINLLAIFIPEDFEDDFLLKNVKIIKDNFTKQTEIKDYMFEEENSIEELKIKWNTTNKNQIKILYVV